MAQQRVLKKDCDRCPVNKQVPATGTFRFAFGDHHWEIDLCEKHLKDIERDMYAWARLGREVEQRVGRMFGSEYHQQARRTSELRSVQWQAEQQDRVHGEAKSGAELLDESVEGPRPAAPDDANEWVFTEHALMRLRERQVRVIDALWAASEPTIVREAREPGLVVHRRGNIHVVLNPSTKAIITVAVVTEINNNNRKAI